MELKNITGAELYGALHHRLLLLYDHQRAALEKTYELLNYLRDNLKPDTSPIDAGTAEYLLDCAAAIVNGTQKSHREICSYDLYAAFIEGYSADAVYRRIIYSEDGIGSVYLSEEKAFVITCVLLPGRSSKKLKSIGRKAFVYENTTDIFAGEMANSIRMTLEKEKENLDLRQVKQGNLAVYYCYNYPRSGGKNGCADATNHYTDQLQNTVLAMFGGDGGRTRFSFENFFIPDADEGTYIIVSTDGNKTFSDGDIEGIIRKTQRRKAP